MASTSTLTWSKLAWGPKLQKGQYLGGWIVYGAKTAIKPLFISQVTVEFWYSILITFWFESSFASVMIRSHNEILLDMNISIKYCHQIG